MLAFINLTLFGVFASLYFIKRGSIWGIGAFHSIWNLVQGNFWGLSVSGGATECSVFRTTMVEGRDSIRRRIRTGRRACGDGSAACGNLRAAEEKRSTVGAAGFLEI